MAEIDFFERSLAGAFLRLADDVPGTVDAAAVAHRVALEHPRHRPAVVRWRVIAVPRPVWILLLLAGLVAALIGGALFVGSRLNAIQPPVGELFECPLGSTPDKPGPVDQVRPESHYLDKVVFDRRAGRLVLARGNLGGWPPETWTFDVCANTWTRMNPHQDKMGFSGQLVYDVDSDVTIGIVSGKVWAYDFQANTWAMKGVAPSGVQLGAYDPVSGLVVDALGGWTYEVEKDTWTQNRLADSPPCEYGLWGSGSAFSVFDASVDRLVTWAPGGWWGGRPMLCLIDLRTGAWSAMPADALPQINTGFYLADPSIAYAEAIGRTVISDGRRWIAYDATTDRWDTLVDGVSGGVPALITYDVLHRRLVGVGWGEGQSAVAFDPVTLAWTVLLERDPAAGPWPKPTPAPTEPPTSTP